MVMAAEQSGRTTWKLKFHRNLPAETQFGVEDLLDPDCLDLEYRPTPRAPRRVQGELNALHLPRHPHRLIHRESRLVLRYETSVYCLLAAGRASRSFVLAALRALHLDPRSSAPLMRQPRALRAVCEPEPHVFGTDTPECDFLNFFMRSSHFDGEYLHDRACVALASVGTTPSCQSLTFTV